MDSMSSVRKIEPGEVHGFPEPAWFVSDTGSATSSLPLFDLR